MKTNLELVKEFFEIAIEFVITFAIYGFMCYAIFRVLAPIFTTGKI